MKIFSILQKLMNRMYSPKIREELIPKLYKLRKIKGKPMTEVVDEILRDYLENVEQGISMVREKESPFMKSLGQYKRPRAGESIRTEYGSAEIIRVKYYDEVVEEMGRNAVSKEEINQFTLRVEPFLKDRKKYFECVILYENGEFDSIDWSEYLALRNEKRDKL